MTYDPYREEGLRRDLPRTEPRPQDMPDMPEGDMPDMPEGQSSMWLPIALVVVLLVGIGYYLYGSTSTTGPSMRADGGAVTKSEPSPN
jgi:hypothetical protein